MPTGSDTFDLCVVGAGPVGGTLACLAATAGLRVAIIDQAPLPPMEHPEFDGRAYAVAAGSKRLLERAGIWTRLPQPAGEIVDIRVTDGRPGRPPSPLSLRFALTETALAEPGAAFGWMVEARSLRVALNHTLHETAGVTVLAPAAAEIHRAADKATITLHDGRRLAAALVAAADGRESRLRREAGIPVTRFTYDQTAIITAITHEMPHNGVAREHFLPAGPFAQLPMADDEHGNHVSAIVWSEPPAVAAHCLALDDNAFGAEIARRLDPALGAIRPVGHRYSYRLSALHAHRYHDTRLVLVGDAAHGIHPIAGQGLNLGFRDLGALVPLLHAAHQAGQDIGAADRLAAYQRQRRPDNLAMLAVTDGLDRLFRARNPLLRLARDMGMAGVDRVAPLKRFFMRQAMGV